MPRPLQAAEPTPLPASVPLLTALLRPRASSSSNHVAGTVDGAQVHYADLNAFAWYTADGWNLRNHRALRRRGLSGAGDVDGQERR